MICPNCGGQTSYTTEQYRYHESGLDNVFVDGVKIFKCHCGEEYVQLPGAREIHDTVASELLHKPSLLTGPEAKFLRKWLRHTSEDLAKALGHTRVTVSRWENDKPSIANDRALRLYAASLGKVEVDFANLFISMSGKPQRQFKIIITEKGGKDCQFGSSVHSSEIPDLNDTSTMGFRGQLDVGVAVIGAANQELALAA